MSWCFLDSSLYWWLRLWHLRLFLVGWARFVCRGWEGSLLSFSPCMRFLRLLLSSVQPAHIGPGSRSTRSGRILHGWSYCCYVHFGQNWWVDTPGSSHQGKFLHTASLHLLYLRLPDKSCASLTPRKVGCLSGARSHPSAAVLSVPLRRKGRRECCLFCHCLSQGPIPASTCWYYWWLLESCRLQWWCVQTHSRMPGRLHVVCLRPSLLQW